MINFSNLPDIKDILLRCSTIAVAGLSPKHERPSNMVARYLIDVGYSVIPINPGQTTILGRTSYPDLLSIPEKVDVVNIFRRSEHVLPIVEQAIVKECTAIWMQQGIINNEAAELAQNNGLKVIMDRCIKVDHSSFLSPN